MMNSVSLVRSILGPVRVNVKFLASSIDRAAELMFVQKISRDDIKVTRDIYTYTAEHEVNIKRKSVYRQIERLANRCWDSIRKDESMMLKYIGKIIYDINGPSDMIFYLAYYIYFGRPFYEVIEILPSLIF